MTTAVRHSPEAKNAAAGARTCGYCSRPHPVSDLVAEENPFCAACLDDRVAAHVKRREGLVTTNITVAMVQAFSEELLTETIVSKRR